MPKETGKYRLGYFEAGERVSASGDLDATRFLTLDRHILGLFEVLGNGVIDGWDIIASDDDTNEVAITAGYGHVDYVAVESESVNISVNAGTTSYIYASLLPDSYYNGTVSFFTSDSILESETALFLGAVTTRGTTCNRTSP